MLRAISALTCVGLALLIGCGGTGGSDFVPSGGAVPATGGETPPLPFADGVAMPGFSGLSAVYDVDLDTVSQQEAVAVGDCLAPSSTEQTVSYSEATPETLTRTLEVQVDVAQAKQLGLDVSAESVLAALDPDAVFGFDVDAQVISTEIGQPSLSLAADRAGQFYRRTVRVQRVAPILAQSDSASLLSVPLGRLVLVDWRFEAELAVGGSCSPVPSL